MLVQIVAVVGTVALDEVVELVFALALQSHPHNHSIVAVAAVALEVMEPKQLVFSFPQQLVQEHSCTIAVDEELVLAAAVSNTFLIKKSF